MSEPLDTATLRVQSIILAATARAYDFRPANRGDLLPPACKMCDGDGCSWCDHTGEQA